MENIDWAKVTEDMKEGIEASIDGYVRRFCDGNFNPAIASRDCLRIAMSAEDVFRQRGWKCSLVAGSAQFCRDLGGECGEKAFWSYQYTEVDELDFGQLITSSYKNHLPEIHCWLELVGLGFLDLTSPMQKFAASMGGFEWNAHPSCSATFMSFENMQVEGYSESGFPVWVPNWQATLLARTIATLIRGRNRKNSAPSSQPVQG